MSRMNEIIKQMQNFSGRDSELSSIEWLIERVGRLETALEKILNHGDDRPDCYPLYNIAEEALNES